MPLSSTPRLAGFPAARWLLPAAALRLVRAGCRARSRCGFAQGWVLGARQVVFVPLYGLAAAGRIACLFDPGPSAVALQVGLGRIVASETEVPNMLVNLR
jgi:hypothetical protein